MGTQDSFVGTWRLVTYYLDRQDGERFYPFGEDAVGYLTYQEDGYMSAGFQKAGRSAFASETMSKASGDEALAAMQTHYSYCGKYEVFSDKIVHHVEVSSFPNWTGSTQERQYFFEGNRLTLRPAPRVVDGVQRTGVQLTWERVE